MQYRKIIEFCYKKNNYVMFLDSKNRRFFMKKGKNDVLEYVTDVEFAELAIFFTSVPKIMNIVKDNEIKIIPKVISGGITVALSLSVLNAGLSRMGIRINSLYPSHTTSEVIESENDFKDYISFDEVDVVTSNLDLYQYDKNEKELSIYDMDYLDLIFDETNVDIDSVNEIINENDDIPDEFKAILFEYIEDVTSKYPNIDLRNFYNNLKDLKVHECDKDEIYIKTGISDSYGFYLRDLNEIYVLENIDYYENSWARQVIYHELSHCLRIGKYQIDDITVNIIPEGPSFNNEITSEALNSIFAVSLFDYEEDVIAYQLQSNYYKIMLECMDNYNISDYINHSLNFFTIKLDEYNNDENYASTILELIQIQFQDYHSTSMTVDQTEYYPIYDYICDMYYGKYITDDMTYDEMRLVADSLVKKITLYVPDDYNIDTDRFYVNLDKYYEKTINYDVNTR